MGDPLGGDTSKTRVQRETEVLKVLQSRCTPLIQVETHKQCTLSSLIVLDALK